MGGTVEVEVEEESEQQGEEVSTDGRSLGATGWRGNSTFGFLDKVEVDERETELDDKVSQGAGAKWKRDEGVQERRTGLGGCQGGKGRVRMSNAAKSGRRRQCVGRKMERDDR